MTVPNKVSEPDLSGQTLDRYHLLSRIGVGGMGAVYEAEHTRLRKRFAVKLLRAELANNEISRKRFLREARAASAVNHPHVVAISDFGDTEEGHVFFVMELLAGHDLHDELQVERVIPWPRAQEILLQVTAALQAAHEQAIIHRDIKPSNVFLADVPGKGDEDFVKVLDFGIAKIAGNVGEVTANLTSTDEIFGTVAYMAPEMAIGKNDDPRSDMYAVGVMMYRMLTGELPYTEGSAFQILSQHINAPIPSPRAKNPAIPEEVEAIVMRAMAKQPDERFPSMEEFNRVLRRGMLQATEVLAGLRSALHAEATRDPLASPSEPDIDKTTPLPTKGAQSGPTSTAATSPLPTPSPFVRADSGALTKNTHPTGDLGGPATGPSDSAAIPQAEKTVVSTPIAIAPAATDRADSATPMGIAPGASAPILADAVASSTPTPALDLGSDSFGQAAAPASVPMVSGDLGDHGGPRRSPLPIVLLVVGFAVAGVIAIVLATRPDDETRAKTPVVAEASPSDVEPKQESITLEQGTTEGSPEASELPQEAEPVDQEPVVEPTHSEGGITEESDLTTNEDSSPLEPEPPKPVKRTKKSSSKPKPKPKPPAKPKTDREVVAGLKVKITSRCKGQASGKVKVEGLINASGKVDNLLVTPQSGLGPCEKIVKGAKFDPAGGVRPMPRFTVEL